MGEFMDASAPWHHFDTAYETMTAVNLALFTFRELRQPVLLEDEDRKWSTLLASLSFDVPIRLPVHQGRLQFDAARHKLEERIEHTRAYSAWVATGCVVMLFLATRYADDPSNPILAWGSLALSVTPAIIFFGYNERAKCLVNAFSTKRRQFERHAA
jgi:hypothetical protein